MSNITKKTPGSSSGCPDVADVPRASDRPEQRNVNPQDATGNGVARGSISEDSTRPAWIDNVKLGPVEAPVPSLKWRDASAHDRIVELELENMHLQAEILRLETVNKQLKNNRKRSEYTDTRHLSQLRAVSRTVVRQRDSLHELHKAYEITLRNNEQCRCLNDALRIENERLKAALPDEHLKQVEQHVALVCRLQFRVAQLEMALEPFAHECDDGPDKPRGGETWEDKDAWCGAIKVKHLRRAKALIVERNKS